MESGAVVAAAVVVATPALAYAQSVGAMATTAAVTPPSPPSKVVPILLGIGIGAVVGFSIVGAILVVSRRRQQRAKMNSSIARTSASSIEPGVAMSYRGMTSMAKHSRRQLPAHGAVDVISLGHRSRVDPPPHCHPHQDKPFRYDMDICASLQSSHPTIEGGDNDVPMLGTWADDEVDSTALTDEDGHHGEHAAVYGATADDDMRGSMVVIEPSDVMCNGFYM
ncbi:hypothetical protein DYB32_003101 [Aphanomyces invadans]|uniref:Uncharacterized protein n=1 Tax=Aphanomyces invadans TaxID=157072 RepID=A0A3R6ZSZ4_9STRA|nr:hypothetical protein DYB32_003101 [Aphanomyces invadans]